MRRMAILAQLSDPHVRLPPDDEGSGAALEAAVRAVLALDPLPDAVVVTGDLADGAQPAEYERVRELLDPLPMPVHLLPGNHDEGVAADYSVQVGGLRLIACDTTIPGHDEGEVDLEWLEAALDEDRETPTIVAMHHPPILTGIGGLDAIGLTNRDALAGLLQRSPQVRRVIAGHVHRGAFGVVGGCGVVACPSTNLQAKLEIGTRRLHDRARAAGLRRPRPGGRRAGLAPPADLGVPNGTSLCTEWPVGRAPELVSFTDGRPRWPSCRPSPRTSPSTARRSSRAISCSPSRRRGIVLREPVDQTLDAGADLQREVRRRAAHELAHVVDRHGTAQAFGLLGLGHVSRLRCRRAGSREGRRCATARPPRWRPRHP